MRTGSFSDLRKYLAETFDSVNNDHAPQLITGRSNKAIAVLMPHEDFITSEAACFPTRTANNAVFTPQASAPVPPLPDRAR